MKSLICIMAVLCGTAASAQHASLAQRVDALWSLYVQGCEALVADPDGFLSSFADQGHQAAYTIHSAEPGNVIAASITWPEFAFSYDAGFAGGKTFMSCGVTTTVTNPDQDAYVRTYEAEIVKRAGDGLIVGGKAPMHTTMPTYAGGFTHHVDENNHFYYTAGVLRNVDTVTFSQLAGSHVSLYFHHVFEGRVGIPAEPPKDVVHIP